MRTQWLLTFIYEYRKVFMYIGLGVLGLFLMWYVRTMFVPSNSSENVEPTPLEQYR